MSQLPKSLLKAVDDKKSEYEFMDKLSFCENKNDYESIKQKFQNKSIRKTKIIIDDFFK